MPQTTGRGLSADEAFVGLVDYGLFGEKLPPCFTSEGLFKLMSEKLLKTRHGIKSIQNAIRERAEKLKGMEVREKGRFWPLIYQVWRKETLRNENQPFLAYLKENRFSFICFP